MDVYAGIDGTGPLDNASYRTQFARSFVSRLQRERSWGKSYYLRGPTMDGQETRQLSRQILREVEGDLHRTTARRVERVVVAGYSRGGAAAIRLCRELGRHGHAVDALLLFDAVDMSLTVAADLVPANVRTCFHARRDPASLSRSFWDNCGRGAEDASRTRYVEHFFRCTHGGMGGVPWTVADSDGVINEAATDRTLSGRIVRGAGLPGLPFAALNEIHRYSSRTSVTLAQDRIVSAQVGAWMFGHLDRVLAAKRRTPALTS
ncbi:hypothetical protein [Aureimonas jatrophae]|uniref:Alpha/beta hydrolase family protein n=1 Tax=Aureimonas jatrophae TaxID=1166073 RepID=A0A1H0K5Y3_9HYPH|nr:hypothetical protein [Aureimonas jatrophae]MBB3950963.1 hypothetical protein [Aureimonas jatrophae]SDO51289.1 hypothetical protein SAMN05192530_107110 [Aureimonas jatrophae]